MCGIVGYIGHRDAYPVILKGLKRLEYRGYDSARSMSEGTLKFSSKIPSFFKKLKMIQPSTLTHS